MKANGKVRTLRGQITAVGGKAEKQLILNDVRFTYHIDGRHRIHSILFISPHNVEWGRSQLVSCWMPCLEVEVAGVC